MVFTWLGRLDTVVDSSRRGNLLWERASQCIGCNLTSTPCPFSHCDEQLLR